MADDELLAALNDPDDFRHFVDTRVTNAMRDAIKKLNDEEDQKLLTMFGIPVVEVPSIFDELAPMRCGDWSLYMDRDCPLCGGFVPAMKPCSCEHGVDHG